MKKKQPFAPHVLVMILDDNGRVEASGTVISYDEEIDMYVVLINENHIESFKSNQIKGWYEL